MSGDSQAVSHMANDAAQFEANLAATIGDALTEGFVTRWVCVLEVIEDDGESTLITAASEDLKVWDTLGMLDYAAERVRSHMAEMYEQDDE